MERRIALFTGDRIESARRIEAGQGQVISLPAFDPTQRQHVVGVYQHASPDQQVRLTEAGNQLFQGLMASSEGLRAGGSVGLPSAMHAPVQYAAETYLATTGERDVNKATNAVLEMAVTSAESDMYGFADELQKNLAEKKQTREEIADFRSQMTETDWSKAGADGKMAFDVPDGKGGHKQVMMTKDEAQNHLDGLQTKLDTASDMTQMAQMRLQDAMNKQSQAIQTLSAIMKNVHDTIKGVLNNLR